MATISFTYGTDYNPLQTVDVGNTSVSEYQDPDRSYGVGVGGSSGYFLFNPWGVPSYSSGQYFSDINGPPDWIHGTNYSIFADFRQNNAVVALGGGDFGDILIGGSAGDSLSGGAGDDRLDGGLGADTMTGGTGNDIFFVDNVGDVVVELAGEGIDQVRTTLDNYVLGANVENLFLMGSADLSGTGNELDNILMGNSGANTLSGGAGDDRLDGRGGADILIGGTGNDTYYIDDLGDVMVEEAGEGYDTAFLSVDGYVLADGVSVERLILRDGIVSATGNDLDNVIQGNAGDNTLAGGGGRDTIRGGAGNDTLIGGAGIDNLYGGTGADTFVLTATTADRDMIRDFVAAEDMIQISASLFGGGLVAGDELTPEQFVLSTTGRATSATDRFLYVESKGHLYYDADGSGRDEAPQLIAVLTTMPTLTAAHFDIVI
ncbi:hemolysin type calcium-binding protein [Enterovirga rhinocerotis]|uniref:Hemolysin type calcium-binding protein n=1 Tax=Enterovirga rhinocerotis TaxID=1339210 RepID=A0A4V3DXJ8_9HYPH|nr:hemolysin type calcium-binding protein [Enterovirga rhinocerotis]